MNARTVCYRDLIFHWRGNLATILAVTTATTVLIGALLVGDSMRGSLRDLAVGRLGQVDYALVTERFIRESLAAEIRSDWRFQSRFALICPLIMLQGSIQNADATARVNRITVLGVDDRFWQFDFGSAGRKRSSRSNSPPLSENLASFGTRSVVLSQSLARELGVEAGRDVLVRVRRPGDVPDEMLFGRRDRGLVSMRLSVSRIVPADGAGGFSLTPTSGDPHNAYVPLATLQRALKPVSYTHLTLPTIYSV